MELIYNQDGIVEDDNYFYFDKPVDFIAKLLENNLVEIKGSEVQMINNYIFNDCTSLQSISFPLCSDIDNYAFQGCTSLQLANFPQCITIGTSAFYNCTSLQSISFPQCTSIGSYAFYSCKSLQIVNFSQCITIGTSAFQYCSSLQSVSFPQCATINSNAFRGCTSLQSISFPQCTSIGSYAFYSCTSLQSIYLLGPSICTLQNSNAFNSTPISQSSYLGHFGSIYVPSSLVDAYKSVTNWITYSSRITAFME